jgi:hypothetical protein
VIEDASAATFTGRATRTQKRAVSVIRVVLFAGTSIGLSAVGTTW